MRFFFKNWPSFFDVPKCRTIYRNLKKTIFTSFICMLVHKLWSVFAHDKSLETQNYGNMMKNLVGHLICYLIGSISSNSTLRALHFCCMLSKIYNIIVRTWINRLILHSYIFHNGRQFWYVQGKFFDGGKRKSLNNIHNKNKLL